MKYQEMIALRGVTPSLIKPKLMVNSIEFLDPLLE
jgi:hypothetical protein